MNRLNVLDLALEHGEVAGCCNPHHWPSLLSAAVRIVTWPIREEEKISIQVPKHVWRRVVRAACNKHVQKARRSRFSSQLFSAFLCGGCLSWSVLCSCLRTCR
jgi:hypothetical protein